LIFLMNNYDGAEIINVGTGKDVSIEELAHTIKDVIGFKGSIVWDASKPDGTPKKLLDVSKLNNLGWKSETSLENGIKQTYDWFKNNYKNSRL
jgi:GDP-L-fucose synthase